MRGGREGGWEGRRVREGGREGRGRKGGGGGGQKDGGKRCRYVLHNVKYQLNLGMGQPVDGVVKMFSDQLNILTTPSTG